MAFKPYMRIVAGVLIVAGIGVSLFTLYRALIKPPQEETVQVPSETPLVPVQSDIGIVPTRLVIPKINVDTEIESVGIAKSGNMAVPDSYERVGWYRNGYKPGEIGSAVLAGHFDNGFGRPAVFGRLNELEAGDTIEVTGEDGETLRYEVIRKEVFDLKSGSTDEIFGASSFEALNIITCDGTWIAEEKTYDKRLVVFTRLISRSDS